MALGPKGLVITQVVPLASRVIASMKTRRLRTTPQRDVRHVPRGVWSLRLRDTVFFDIACVSRPKTWVMTRLTPLATSCRPLRGLAHLDPLRELDMESVSKSIHEGAQQIPKNSITPICPKSGVFNSPLPTSPADRCQQPSMRGHATPWQRSFGRGDLLATGLV